VPGPQEARARAAGQPPVAAATDPAAKVRINVMLAPSLRSPLPAHRPCLYLCATRKGRVRAGGQAARQPLPTDGRAYGIGLDVAGPRNCGGAEGPGGCANCALRQSVGASGDPFGESAYLVVVTG